MTYLRRYWPIGAVAVLAFLPYAGISVPGVFDGPLNSPGTLQLLALCLLFGGLATGYDLLFGRTGLLSFGHALFVALGAYGADVLIGKAGLPLAVAAPAAILLGTTVAAAVGAIALRVTGIAFAMVTLAFAQVGAILAARDAWGLTGGDEGLALDVSGLPSGLVGVVNTYKLYWVSLAYLVIVMIVVRRTVSSPTGRVLAGLRDDERRVGVLGLNPYAFKLFAFVLAGALAAAGGVVHLLLVQGADPKIAGSELTLSLLVMVVLGGPGTRYGPLLGGVLYTYLDYRLTHVAGGLPGPLKQPLFVLGVVFILAVYFFPGGIAQLRLTALRRAVG
ncbi:branched-chain amino acid transport system permease protein [Hamadaea flava]|uniref:Branched-chain amino acid ABC transporter permease n=1 Tax=Hamadaea flava TaxID=1742688 RepID=A0ABV8LFG3_9ACTN|nr:branched-chain amino acid ABC transporter permease [Hamadaea flava]MCP2326383.1 branched-chain amino acid transport system permease protein [Hamadaea flava]